MGFMYDPNAGVSWGVTAGKLAVGSSVMAIVVGCFWTMKSFI